MKKEFEKLGLLNINDYFEFAKNNFSCGWIDNNGNKHFGVNDALSYSLQSPSELLKTRIGICWDLTELSRSFFEEMTDLRFETYYLFYDDNAGCPSHTFLVFYYSNKVYLFEPMYNDSNSCYNGINVYDSLKELLKAATREFIKSMLLRKNIPTNFDRDQLYIYKYIKPRYHINRCEMRNHINASERIDVLCDRKSL